VNTTDSPPVVTLEKTGDVATILIDFPPVNAASHAVRAGIVARLAEADADPAIRAIVLRCAGRTFVAGADITEFGRPPADPWLPAVCDALEASAKPVVAAIHGTALGGGLELALACHGRVALTSAKVGLPEVKLGLLPGAGGTQRLPRIVGVERAFETIVGGEPVAAAQAATLGLLDRVVDAALPEPAARRGARGIGPWTRRRCRRAGSPSCSAAPPRRRADSPRRAGSPRRCTAPRR
jgi:3-hydroxyacyl-CoA dehydrogenase